MVLFLLKTVHKTGKTGRKGAKTHVKTGRKGAKTHVKTGNNTPGSIKQGITHPGGIRQG